MIVKLTLAGWKDLLTFRDLSAYEWVNIYSVDLFRLTSSSNK